MASIVYGVLFQYIGWHGMFMVGVIPALLVFYIRRRVPESPSWKPTTASSNTASILKSNWRLGFYAVLLMTAFNFFSHGTQDLYPTFLQVQHGFGPHEVGLIAVIYNVGAIIGGISFGSLSERFGRRRIIIIAMRTLIASIEKRIIAHHRLDEASKRLRSIPGIGLVGATTVGHDHGPARPGLGQVGAHRRYLQPSRLCLRRRAQCLYLPSWRRADQHRQFRETSPAAWCDA